MFAQELGPNERIDKCSNEECETLHLRRNDSSLENVDARNEETRAHNMVNNGRTTDIVNQTLNDPNDNETFLSKHLHRLIKIFRRLSQKSNKETDRTAKEESESDIKTSEELGELSDSVEMYFKTLEERCRYYWNANSDSDDESDLGDNDNDRSRSAG